MATPNRAALITKIHKVLKKHYKAHAPDLNRPVLEQFLYACCLENAHVEPAEAAYSALKNGFFDWNEVRVSSIAELAETIHVLPDAVSAATRLRRVLQSVFESTYSFDLESFRKQNLGQAVAKLQKLNGSTPFTVACVTQFSLGGHAIPVDRGTLDALFVVGLVNESNIAESNVPGLDRAVPKTKGLEFGSLLHQLGADFVTNRYSTELHKILLEMSPDAKNRLPKRQAKKPVAETEPVSDSKPASKKPPAADQKRPAADKDRGSDKRKPAETKKTAEPKKSSPPKAVSGAGKKAPVAGKRKPR